LSQCRGLEIGCALIAEVAGGVKASRDRLLDLLKQSGKIGELAGDADTERVGEEAERSG
jgi:hypothetical protein